MPALKRTYRKFPQNSDVGISMDSYWDGYTMSVGSTPMIVGDIPCKPTRTHHFHISNSGKKKKIDKKHVLPKIVIVHILPYMTFHISILVLP